MRYSPDLLKRLRSWNESNEVVQIAISSRSDLSSPCVNYGNGQILPIHAAWDAPVEQGILRLAKLHRTKRGTYYFVPAAVRKTDDAPQGACTESFLRRYEEAPKGAWVHLDDLRPNEFDPARQRNFRARLWKNGGRYSFKLESGLRLLPKDIEQWVEAGIDEYEGRELDVTGWPGATCWMVIPKFGFGAVGMTDSMGTRPSATDRESQEYKRAVERERQGGIIRIPAGEQTHPVGATVILGIPSDTKLSREIVKFAARTRMKEIQNGDDTVIIADTVFAKDRLIAACTEARNLLYQLVDEGFTCFVKDESSGVEEEQTLEPEIIPCQVCGEKNRVDPSKGPRELAVCRNEKCKHSLFPVNHWAEEVALQAVEESYQGSKIGGADVLKQLLREKFEFLTQLSNNGSLNERAPIIAEKLGSTKIDGRRIAIAAEKVWSCRLKADRTKKQKTAS